MFQNRTKSGRNNLVGLSIARRRKEMHVSQRELADRLTVIGLDVDKNAVQRIESGQRFVTDIEMLYLSKIFNITIKDLYSDSETETDIRPE